MRTERQEFYIRHDFSFFDCGILAVLPHHLFLLYDLLRRFVWRSEQSACPLVRKLRAEGCVVANVRQGTLAEMLGYASADGICRNLAPLKQLGWIRVVTDTKSTTTCYVLGEVVTDGEGGRHEVFYADAIMADLIDQLDAAAQKTHGPEASMRRLSYTERVEIAKAYVDLRLEGSVRKSAEGRCGNPQEGGAEIRNPRSRGTSYPSNTSEEDKRHRANHGGLRPPHPPLNPGIHEGSVPLEGIQPDPGEDLEVHPEPDPIPELPSTGTGARTQPTGLDALLEQKRREFEQNQKATASQQVHAAGVDSRRLETLTKGKQRTPSEKNKLRDLEAIWRLAMLKLRPELVLAAWGPKEHGNVLRLADSYGVELLGRIITYMVENWAELRTRIFKGKAALPTLSILVAMHETFAAEVQTRTVDKSLQAEIDAWYAAHPNESLPEELARRYAAANPST